MDTERASIESAREEARGVIAAYGVKERDVDELANRMEQIYGRVRAVSQQDQER